MSIARSFYCVVFTGIISLGCHAQLLAQTSSDVVAQVGGVQLTRAELEQQEASKLLQARYQYYQAESKALEDLVDQTLLEQKAKHENLTVDQLLARDVTSQIEDPTDDQMRVFYEGLETDQPYEAVRPKILEKIRQARTDKARVAYLKALRKQADVHIALAGPTARVNVENADLLGSKSAPVLLVEFADYECPYCQRVAPELKKITDEFGEKIAFAYKDFPLPMHSHAEKAAEAARCAGKQGKFWEYHDELFRRKALDVDQLKAEAQALSLNSAAFDKCLDSGEESAAVAHDRTEGVGLGLSGTPSFFINGHYYSGALDYSALHQLIEQQLGTSSQKSEITASK